MAIIEYEETGSDDAEDVEAHLHEIAAVVEKSHTREHDQEL